ncbi:hypothetical protein KIPB_010108 [Kipferlia bialata]|uniref:Ig-like domain-containing protein n=1 Tax=Kipferlia bialata TaxID=797122 RepID=A0A9K3GM41_9EUKA|nr:hypothetical protein KIPB_010108 [Kipferlia bialata]|eukprot:g10108.t1
MEGVSIRDTAPEQSILELVQAVDGTIVSVLASCTRVGVDVLEEGAIAWESTGAKGSFHLVSDGTYISVVVLRPDGASFTCLLDPEQAARSSTRDLKNHASNDRTRPKYSFRFACESDRDSVYELIRAALPHPSESASDVSATLPPVTDSVVGGDSLYPLPQTPDNAERGVEGTKARQHPINESPPPTPAKRSTARSLPRLPVQVMPLADDFSGKTIPSLDPLADLVSPKGRKTKSRATRSRLGLKSKGRNRRLPGLSRPVTLRMIALTVALSICFSLLGGAVVTWFLLSHAGTVSAKVLDAVDITAAEIVTGGIVADRVQTREIETDTLVSSSGCRGTGCVHPQQLPFLIRHLRGRVWGGVPTGYGVWPG